MSVCVCVSVCVDQVYDQTSVCRPGEKDKFVCVDELDRTDMFAMTRRTGQTLLTR